MHLKTTTFGESSLLNSPDKLTRGNLYWFIPALCAAVLTVAAYTGNALYEANDDLTMIAILAGKWGLRRSPDAVFLSPLLGHLLHSLYSWTEKIPWLGALLYAVLASGYAIGCRTLLDRIGSLLARLAAIATLTGFAWYLFFNFNFGAVALFLWLMVTARFISQRGMNRWHPFRLSLLLAITPLIRPDMAIIAASITLPALFCLMGRQEWKRLLWFLLPAIFMTALSLLWISTTTDPLLREFNSLRSRYFDTPISATGGNTPAALKAAGWSDQDYTLFNEHWIYDDTLFTSAKIKKFIAANGPVTAKTYFEQGLSYISESRQYLLLLIVAVAALLASPRQFTRPSVPSCIFLFLTAFTVTALVIIRFPLLVAVPTYAYLFLLAAVLLPPQLKERRGRLNAAVQVLGAVIIVVLLGRIIDTVYTDNRSFKSLMEHVDRQFATISGFVRPETVFVAANATALNLVDGHPLRKFPVNAKNRQFPCGWLISSRHYDTFLADNGLIPRPVVPYFIDNPGIILYYFQTSGKPFPEYAELLTSHLSANYRRFIQDKSVKLQVLQTPNPPDANGVIFFKITTEQTGEPVQ